MAKAFKDKRAIFPSGKQRTFLERIAEKITVAEMARISGYSERAFRDWRREKFSMPLTTVHALSKRSGVQVPKSMGTRDAYAHTARAGKMGIAAVIKRYGRIPHDEQYRKKQWRIWWESSGKFKKSPILGSKAIYRPKRSEELAEFVGIMMGDGGISEYQTVITLHHIDDFEYASFVMNTIKRLFRVTPSIYHSPKKSVNNIVVSRKELVKYLHELGLPVGNKIRQQFDIPKWIKDDRKFSIACLRGLVDTDGCIFTHRYKVKGKWYAYKKLSFTSASKPLRKSVFAFLYEFGFHPRITEEDVRLSSIEDMRQYFLSIGSHNPKHLRRYESAVG